MKRIERIGNNLVNGNLKDAKLFAEPISGELIYCGLMDLGWPQERAVAAACYVKRPSAQTWAEWCRVMEPAW
jgi:hypothetical protein